MAPKAWDSSLRLPGLILESRTVIDGTVEMSGRLAAEGANCPDCAMPSKSLHSRYDRRLSDLPVSGSTVRLRLSVRRFVVCTRLAHGAHSASRWLRLLAADMAAGWGVATRWCARWRWLWEAGRVRG